ncbi:1-deoxy-D-xylulose-5-phosphate reductoisomerase [Caldalkalibacillus salinus]|uniref:1-deoxy-D-xylulose-5-phosphate reductoisomerase n=1 Tax=Caldalkalibacillus salinus TaxID=2803787 RepID=UPI0019228D25|nr:1-deoxy-D-xylulose-5-phosphate reductoisomerase [Caldalkalibacillus salinus]
MKHIAILGSTGSVGTQTLEVVRSHATMYKVEAIAAGTNQSLIIEQVNEFQPQLVSVATKDIADELRPHIPQHVKLYYGIAGLIEVATIEAVDVVVTAVVGSMGLKPTLAAIEAGKTIALANKETLVSGGHLVMEQIKQHGTKILPVDSEHSAIYQCLQGEHRAGVDEIILTASGGSFRDKSRAELQHVTVRDALNHPNWSMGAKITIDSATMMNKGLEIIEAHWLFDTPYEDLSVLLHDESIIHSMVRFKDQAVMAQLGTPDMKVPIQYALSYPERLSLNSTKLDLAALGKLHFREMDFDRYPCLKMAFDAGKMGGSMPTVLNAANEIAVQRFLQGDITFLDIERVIEQVLERHDNIRSPNLMEIEETDLWARQLAKSVSL